MFSTLSLATSSKPTQLFHSSSEEDSALPRFETSNLAAFVGKIEPEATTTTTPQVTDTKAALSKQNRDSEPCRDEDESDEGDAEGLQDATKKFPPSEESILQLSSLLPFTALTLSHCLYVGNISVRADKTQVTKMMATLGDLICFEFLIRDKQFRFQGGIAVFRDSPENLSKVKSRPFVVFKRKLRVSDLASRNNCSTLLGLLVKKLSPTSSEGIEQNPSKEKTSQSTSLASEAKVELVQRTSKPAHNKIVDKEKANNTSKAGKKEAKVIRNVEDRTQETEKHLINPSGESDTILSNLSDNSERSPTLPTPAFNKFIIPICRDPTDNTHLLSQNQKKGGIYKSIEKRPSEYKKQNGAQKKICGINDSQYCSRVSACILQQERLVSIGENHSSQNVKFNSRSIKSQKKSQFLPAAAQWRGLFC